MDPASFRETEFAWGAQGAESLPAWRLSPRLFDAGLANPDGKRGPRPGFGIAMGLDGGQSPMGPYGATEHGWQKVAGGPLRGKATDRPGVPSTPFGQSSSGFQALKKGWLSSATL